MQRTAMHLATVAASTETPIGLVVAIGVLVIIAGVLVVMHRASLRSTFIATERWMREKGLVDPEESLRELESQTTGHIAFCGVVLVLIGAMTIVSAVAGLY